MRNTENLLTTALDAAADTVRPETVRPLAGPRSGPPAGPGRWGARLAPVAAAAAVILVVAVALVVSGGTGLGRAVGGGAAAGAGHGTPTQPAAAPPTYYSEVEGLIYSGRGNQVVIRATATGAVVTRVANPVLADRPLSALSVAAAPDDRTFYAVYSEDAYMGTGDLVIYRFHLTGQGAVTGLAEIKGGLIAGQNILFNLGGFAVSPDGSQLALAVAATSTDNAASAVAAEVLVINSQTGTHTVWRGGLNRAGRTLAVVDVSWTGNGKTLAYLAQWCPAAAAAESMTGVTCQYIPSASQVRELDVAAGGGTLTSGSVLLQQSARYRLIAQALIDPDGTELSALVQDGSGLQVVRISVATGKITDVLYSPVTVGATFEGVRLAADSTGRYLLLTVGGNGPTHGWIQGGRLRELAPFIPSADVNHGWMQLAW